MRTGKLNTAVEMPMPGFGVFGVKDLDEFDGGVIVIPKSVRKESIGENFNSHDFELSAEDIEAIKTLDTNASLFFNHRNPTIAKLLDERKLNN